MVIRQFPVINPRLDRVAKEGRGLIKSVVGLQRCFYGGFGPGECIGNNVVFALHVSDVRGSFGDGGQLTGLSTRDWFRNFPERGDDGFVVGEDRKLSSF